MALILADRVRETTSTTGTGTLTLTGPFSGFRAFSAIGDGNTTYYAIADANTGEWEVGVGTYSTSGNTLSRDTVLDSSNTGSLVVFATGAKDVICTQPAERAVYLEAAGTSTIVPGITISGLTASTALALDASKDIVSVANTGTGSNVLNTSPTLVTPALGTPSALVGTNITGTAAGLTAGNTTTNANLTGAVTSTGNATSLGSFTSAQLATALTDETGSGANVFATSPTLVTPALGTPSSGIVTNLTGTASININGTVGASTPSTGAFTTLSASGATTLSTLRVASILDASGGATTTINGFTPTVSNMAGRNRLINGDFRIDQRNAGAAVTVTGYMDTLDRWLVANTTATGTITNQQSTLGNSKSHKITATAAVTDLTAAKTVFGAYQAIESQNCFDLNSKTVTLSFKIETNWSGNLAVALRNYNFTRGIVVEVPVVAGVNTKSVTFTLEAATILANDNSRGLQIHIGSNNEGNNQTATAGVWAVGDIFTLTTTTQWAKTTGNFINVTEVQLEEGSVATPFEHRMYGQELALCQRYYQLTNAASGVANSTLTQIGVVISWQVQMRSAPTIGLTGVYSMTDAYTADFVQSSATLGTTFGSGTNASYTILSSFSGLTNGRAYLTRFGNTNAITLSAEL